MGCFVVATFPLTSTSCCNSAISQLVNFVSPVHISGMAEDKSCQILCIGRLYQVMPSGLQITPKGAWLCSRDPFLHRQLRT